MTRHSMKVVCLLLVLLLDSAYSQSQAVLDKQAGGGPTNESSAGFFVSFMHDSFTPPFYVVTLPDPAASCPESGGFQPGARKLSIYDSLGKPMESVLLCGDVVVHTTIYVYDTMCLVERQIYGDEKDRLDPATSYEYGYDPEGTHWNWNMKCDWDTFPGSTSIFSRGLPEVS